MQKYLLNAVVVGAMIVLTGCQSTTPTGSTFLNPIPSFTPYRTNMTAAQTIKAELERSGDPLLAHVNVEPYQNTIVLTGYVKKIRQSDTAETIATRIVGPQNVQNNIIIRP